MIRRLSILASFLFLALIGLTIYNRVVELRTIISRTSPTAPESAPAAFAAPFVPRSFIPGGFKTLPEFRAALADPMLRLAYGDFDFSHARFERLGHPECLFVAYRSGPKFAWTRRCKILKAGELILTDGKYRIRAKCGNLLSAQPEAPTFADGIDDDFVLDTNTPMPPDAPTNLTAQVPPPPSPISTPEPPFAPPIITPPSVPVVPVCTNCRHSVPEGGSTITYVLIGLFVCAVAYAYK